MASTSTAPAASIDFRSLSKDDPLYQEKIDTALFQAVNAAVEQDVVELVALGANPTATQKKGRLNTTHALLVAVQSELSDGASSVLIPALCKASKIDANAADNQGNTALHVAAQRSQLVTVERLLAIGANALSKNLQENTPIHQSVSRPSSSSESERERARKTVEILLAKAREFVVENGLPRNKQGDSILIKSVHQGNLEGAQVIVEFVKQLVKEGQLEKAKAVAALNQTNFKGFGPLHEAAIWAKLELLQYLVDECRIDGSVVFEVTATDAEGNTALHLAGDRRQTGIPTTALDHVSFLLDHKLPVNAQNSAGDTCFHISHISREFLDLVLSRGADVTLLNAQRDSPLAAQLRGGRAHNVESILLHIVEKKIDMAQFKDSIIAIKDQFGNTMAHLLAKIDSEISSISPPELSQIANLDGETPIQVAIEERSLHVLTTLVEFATEAQKEAIRNARDNEGNSLLHQAVQMDYVAGATALLDHAKCDVNIPNTEMDEFSDGGLPVHLAAFYGSNKALEFLLSRGASIDSQANPSQDTPLHLAIRFNRFECVQTLLNLGASQSLKNRDGLTAPEEVKSLRGIDENIRKLFVAEE